METPPRPQYASTHCYNHYGNAIQLKQLPSNNNSQENGSSSEDDEVQFTRKQYKIVSLKTVPRPAPTYPLEEVPPLSVTVSDVLFNSIVLLIVCLNLVVDVTLVFYHYNTGNTWASGLTCLCLGTGGLALLGQFWGVTYDQIDRIYTRGKCVRLWVNSFPWFATVITSYQSTSTSLSSRRNPMLIQKHVKLQELLHSFLLVQGLAQCAPQAVLQLIVLLEELHTVTWIKATILSTSIATNLSTMMVSNLPQKSASELTPAAYNPNTRVFIGLRMISSFSSRTLSLSILFSTSRCIFPTLIPTTTVISHLIPLSVLLLPRLIFTLVDYTHTRLKLKRQVATQQPELQVLNPPRKTRFADIFLSYVATVFIPFSDPAWVFWYVSVETLVFVTYGVVGNLLAECASLWVTVGVTVVFAIVFGIVSCVVPVINHKVKQRRRVFS